MVEKRGDGYYNEVLPPNSGNALSGTESISTTATEVMSGASRLADRRGVYLQNQSDTVMLWGYSSSSCVCKLSADTDSDGTGGHIWIEVGDNQAIFVKVATGSGKTLAFTEQV